MTATLNTRTVSQLDGKPVRIQNSLGDPPDMVRAFVQGFQGSMLFWRDEIIHAVLGVNEIG